MQKEIVALEWFATWDWVSLPLGKEAIGYKWVYKVNKKLMEQLRGWRLDWWPKDTHKSIESNPFPYSQVAQGPL